MLAADMNFRRHFLYIALSTCLTRCHRTRNIDELLCEAYYYDNGDNDDGDDMMMMMI
jgi:hypothetical protein